MALNLLDNRNRAIGVAGALAINALLLALLLTLADGLVPPALRAPGLTTFDIARPPPPPPDTRPAGAAAPPSRGATRAPAPSHPSPPLAKPTPGPPAIDPGSQSASGAGSAAGSGAGRGGQGSGTGAGGNGSGAVASQPVHIAGDFTAADYRRSGLPKGTGGQVIVSMRVRRDGRVDRCRVARSSGYAAIDEATCRLIEQRFRFRPARDARGEPVDAQIQWAAAWQPR